MLIIEWPSWTAGPQNQRPLISSSKANKRLVDNNALFYPLGICIFHLLDLLLTLHSPVLSRRCDAFLITYRKYDNISHLR